MANETNSFTFGNRSTKVMQFLYKNHFTRELIGKILIYILVVPNTQDQVNSLLLVFINLNFLGEILLTNCPKSSSMG